MDKTPFSLLERLRRPDDADAWPRFVALAVPFLFDVARRWGLQDADAADVVRDVFAVLAQKLPAFRHDLSRWRRRPAGGSGGHGRGHRAVAVLQAADTRSQAEQVGQRPAGLGERPLQAE